MRMAFQISEGPFSKRDSISRHLHKFHCSHLRYRIPQAPKLAGTSDITEQLHTSQQLLCQDVVGKLAEYSQFF